MDLVTLLKRVGLKALSEGSNYTAWINWYESQIERLCRIGVGNKTEYGTVVTDRLIDVYKRRLNELKLVRRNSLWVK